jgi:hypothetical protein
MLNLVLSELKECLDSYYCSQQNAQPGQHKPYLVNCRMQSRNVLCLGRVYSRYLRLNRCYS